MGTAMVLNCNTYSLDNLKKSSELFSVTYLESTDNSTHRVIASNKYVNIHKILQRVP
jgi:hypothetical protein